MRWPNRREGLYIVGSLLCLGVAFELGCLSMRHYKAVGYENIIVDTGWVRAARQCWPDLSSWHDDVISNSLRDPARFRSAFPGYKTFSDQQTIGLLAKPASQATVPDQAAVQGFQPQVVSVKDSGVQGRTQDILSSGAKPNEDTGPWNDYAKTSPQSEQLKASSKRDIFDRVSQQQTDRNLPPVPKGYSLTRSGQGDDPYKDTAVPISALCLVQQNIPSGFIR